MAFGHEIRTWFEGRWHDGDVPVMRAADHGTWQGSNVFDGARMFDGRVPDLGPHCARVNRSAEALMITPTLSADEIEGLAREGLRAYDPATAVYVRPMYWAIDASPQSKSFLMNSAYGCNGHIDKVYRLFLVE
jgi:branched-chain amino acid aminotransferase